MVKADDPPHTGIVCRSCKQQVAILTDVGTIRCPACGAEWDPLAPPQPAKA